MNISHESNFWGFNLRDQQWKIVLSFLLSPEFTKIFLQVLLVIPPAFSSNTQVTQPLWIPRTSQLLQKNGVKNYHRHQWQLPVICSNGWWCCFMPGIRRPTPPELLRSALLEPPSPRDANPSPSVVMQKLPSQRREARVASTQCQQCPGRAESVAPRRERFVPSLFPVCFQARSSRWHCPLCLAPSGLPLGAPPRTEHRPQGQRAQPGTRLGSSPAKENTRLNTVLMYSIAATVCSGCSWAGFKCSCTGTPQRGWSRDGWPALLVYPWQAVGGHLWRRIISPYQNWMLTGRRSKAEGSARKKNRKLVG